MLEKLRNLLPYEKRQEVYLGAAAVVVLLAGLGLVDQNVTGLWTAAVVGVLTLLYALLHSVSTSRTALYGLLVVLQPLAVWYSIGSDQAWTAVIVFAGTIFGLNKAAIKAPIVIDETGAVIQHGRYENTE